MTGYNRFSDFSEEPQTLEGNKMKIDNILNREILIINYSVKNSQYGKNKSGKYLTLQFELNGDGNRNVLFTGSDILIDQLTRYKDKLPFLATIKKINRYYTLT